MANKRPKQLLILMVDDSQEDIELVRESFDESPIPTLVKAIRSGDEALAYLRQAARDETLREPGMILLDLNMPGINGFEILKQIRDDKRLSYIPVIVLSSSSSDHDVDRCYRLHVDAYVVKPVQLDQFGQLVQAIQPFWLETARLPTIQAAAVE